MEDEELELDSRWDADEDFEGPSEDKSAYWTWVQNNPEWDGEDY
jgi:hypothetical protein